MLKLVRYFKENKISLNHLVDRLESSYRALDSMDESWKKKFFPKWGDLEEVFAATLANTPPDAPELIFSDEDRNVMNTAVDELEKLLVETVKDIPDYEENYGT
jgi:hypothetical protein